MRKNEEKQKNVCRISREDGCYKLIKDDDTLWNFATAADVELFLIEPEEVIGLTRGDC